MLRMAKYQKMKTTNNDIKQVGGDHYQFPIKPWYEFRRMGVTWAQGEIAKYLCRWPYKGGIQDLRKALSIAQKYKGTKVAWRFRFCNYQEEFLLQYQNIYGPKFYIFNKVMTLTLRGKWSEVEEGIKNLIQYFEHHEEA